MPALFSIPQAQLRGNSVLIYFAPQYPISKYGTSSQRREILRRLRISILQKLNDEHKTYSGRLTPGTRKRCAKAISLLIQTSPPREIYNYVTHRKQMFQLSMLVLTIPEMNYNVTLKDGYKNLLKPFIDWLVKTKKVNTYVWKAEVQKRGQLHYHITTPSWIHHKEIRNKWNYLLNKSNLMEEYVLEHGHCNPPSTYIKKVHAIQDLQAYLLKEFCKSIQNNHSSTGKIWDCSTNLKGVPYFTVELKDFHEKQLLKCDKKLILKEVLTDHCIILKHKKNWSSLILTRTELSCYNNFLSKIKREVPGMFS